MQDLTLVILAAGMGSRFGGLKQIEPVGPNGEFIIDYSIYDAIKAGFTKVVFIIKEENYELFKNTVGKRVEDKINVEYVFQDIHDIPQVVELPKDRVKPLGTAQALYCTRNVVKESFAVITSDDFYGGESFQILADNLINSDDYVVVGYEIEKTMSENGSVKRGICFENNNYIEQIIESKVEKINGKIECVPLDGREKFTVPGNTPAFMLMVGLRPNIYEFINENIKEFLIQNRNDLSTCEYLLPSVLDEMLKNNLIKIKLTATPSVWMGMTYKEDVDKLKEFILRKIEEGVYPENLY